MALETRIAAFEGGQLRLLGSDEGCREVVLHEHDVPDFDDLWVILVHQLTAVNARASPTGERWSTNLPFNTTMIIPTNARSEPFKYELQYNWE